MRKLLRTARSRACRQPAVVASEPSFELPPAVFAAINKATVLRRDCEEGPKRRIVVKLPGSQGWYHGPETSRNALALRFPDLNAEQIGEACALLRSIVSAHVRVARRIERGPSWATSW